MLSLTGCARRKHCSLLYHATKISTVDIVEIGSISKEEIEIRNVFIVENSSELIDDINKLKGMSTITPPDIEENSTAIRITYLNGECELISDFGHLALTEERNYWHSYKICFHDTEEFNDLINKYMP